MFTVFPWVDSILINGFVNGKKLKNNLDEFSWLEIVFRRPFRSNFNPPPEFWDDTCMGYFTDTIVVLMLLRFFTFGCFTFTIGIFLCTWILRLTFQKILHGKAVSVFTATRLTKWRENPIWFSSHAKKKSYRVCDWSYDIFHVWKNRMTNKIASQKKSDDFYSKRLLCVNLSTRIIININWY